MERALDSDFCEVWAVVYGQEPWQETEEEAAQVQADVDASTPLQNEP